MMSAKIKWQRSAAAPPPLVPPNLADIGAVDFTADDHRILAAWLSEDGWPRERMDVAMLEGYLVAMIIWPVELSPGAWLPSIWGIRGWKVAAKILAPEAYLRFVRLVIGYRQRLARELNTNARGFVDDFTHLLATSSTPNAPTRWGHGFLLALHQGSQGFDWRTSEVTAAVQLLVDSVQAATTPEAKSQETVIAELAGAVLTIVADKAMGRTSTTGKPRTPSPYH